MLKVGKKIYRNIQEQVQKNMDDIEGIKKTIPYPADEYYNKDEVDAMIPKYHKVTFLINNYSQQAIYMHPSAEALTDEEFKEFLKKIKFLKVVGNQNGGISDCVKWDTPNENTISFRSIWISEGTLISDTEEFEADTITFTDEVIEI